MKDVKMWTHGLMTPYVDNKPHKLFVKKESINPTYQELKKTIKKDGGIPLGIDHIQEEDLNKYPILKQLDLLNVGTIHDVFAKNDEIYIKKASISNPMIQQLYDEGKLKALSSVGNIYSKPCSTGQADSVAYQTRIERVDFVPKGACETCTIENNKNDNGIFNARLSAKKGEIMPENGNQDNEFNQEEFEKKLLESIDKKLDEKMDEKLEPITKDIDKIKEEIELEEDPEKDPDNGGEGGDKVSAKLAEQDKKIEKQEKELAAMKAEKDDAVAEALVESSIQAGKALPKQKESLVAFAKADPEAYKTHMETIKPFVPLEKRGLEAGKGNNDKDNELYMPSDYAKDKKALGK